MAEWLQQPPAKETKDFTLAASSALTSALKLAQTDAESGVHEARSMLGDRGEALTKVAQQMGDTEDGNQSGN
ncbi:hypothetical protein ACFCX6_37365 [Streptomyces sp. NPDC056353]|uniref:hypothetical protein n=1 Tax=Streptomyces sp. NPDC056353 TaxID=3345792 RepID=UPI0035D70014